MFWSSMTRGRWLALVLGFVLIVTACGPASQPAAPLTLTPTIAPTATAEIGDPEHGREIFKDTTYVRCEGCHSLDGSEFRGGPTMLGISERAGTRIAGLSAVEYLRQSILEPSAFVVEGFEDKMKVYELVERPEGEVKALLTLTEAELNDLIAFLLTQ